MKDKLSEWQQEIVVSVATANIMAPHTVPKEKYKKHYLGIAIYSVCI